MVGSDLTRLEESEKVKCLLESPGVDKRPEKSRFVITKKC